MTQQGNTQESAWALDDGLLASMRKGIKGTMTVVDLRNQTIGIPISLSGFTAATGEVL